MMERIAYVEQLDSVIVGDEGDDLELEEGVWGAKAEGVWEKNEKSKTKNRGSNSKSL